MRLSYDLINQLILEPDRSRKMVSYTVPKDTPVLKKGQRIVRYLNDESRSHGINYVSIVNERGERFVTTNTEVRDNAILTSPLSVKKDEIRNKMNQSF